MAIPFYQELDNPPERIKVTEESVYTISPYVQAFPGFFVPDGTLIKMKSDHSGSDFSLDIEYCQKTIAENYFYEDEKTKILSVSPLDKCQNNYITNDDKLLGIRHQEGNDDVTAIFQNEINRLRNRHKQLSNSNCVNYYDVKEFFNRGLTHQDWHNALTGQQTVYSEEIREYIKNVIKAKIYVYYYFLNLCQASKNPKEVILKFYRLIENIDFCKIDFAVSFIGFDKIESQTIKEITTSRLNINEAFFYYIISGYKITRIPRYDLNITTNEFKEVSKDMFNDQTPIFEYEKEREYAKRIEEIRAEVSPENIRRFFI
jgi:hypothetical protein